MWTDFTVMMWSNGNIMGYCINFSRVILPNFITHVYSAQIANIQTGVNHYYQKLCCTNTVMAFACLISTVTMQSTMHSIAIVAEKDAEASDIHFHIARIA